MEQELPRRLLEDIFECGIEYHSRRRFRQWCDCSYCEARKQLTSEILWGARRYFNGFLVPGYLSHTCYCTTGCQNGCEQLPPCDELEVAIQNRIERAREKIRCKLRQTLLRMRQEHLFEIHVDEEGKEIWKPRTSPPRRK